MGKGKLLGLDKDGDGDEAQPVTVNVTVTDALALGLDCDPLTAGAQTTGFTILVGVVPGWLVEASKHATMLAHAVGF